MKRPLPRSLLLIVCTSLIIWFSQSVLGEKLRVSTTASSSGWDLSIVGVYQVDDEIWVTTDLEFGGQGFLTVITFPYDELEVELPTIAVKHKGDLTQVWADNTLVRHREQIADFDYSLGDGWVDTDVAGWLYIRSYPWVWHPQLGWSYALQDQPVSEQQFQRRSLHLDEGWCGTGVRLAGSGLSSMSFFFSSSEYGWLWKSPYIEKYWVLDTDEWLATDALVGAGGEG